MIGPPDRRIDEAGALVIRNQPDPRAAFVEVAGETLNQSRLPRAEESADHDVVGWHTGKVNASGGSFKSALPTLKYDRRRLSGSLLSSFLNCGIAS
jgi:hypothetical protein